MFSQIPSTCINIGSLVMELIKADRNYILKQHLINISRIAEMKTKKEYGFTMKVLNGMISQKLFAFFLIEAIRF